MDNSGEIKIKALPRSNEGAQAKKPDGTEKPKVAKPPRYIIYVGIAALALGAFTFFSNGPKSSKTIQAEKAKSKAAGKADLASTTTRINESVTRHLQDAEIQHEMMKRTRELENAPFKNAINEGDDDLLALLPDENKSFGVQLDSDGAAERVYEDLNGEPTTYSDTLPADKINARIANRKWMNEMERTEKINFISTFIRSAYDRGYEVEIDQNLVVVGVKRINKNKILDINQVIDRLAKGQQPGAGS
ncbi:MAG: hypothetical protein ACXVA9_10200 [Bdellovibrionales bacterium]